MSDKNPSRKRVSRLSTPVRLGVAAVAACFISAPVLSCTVNSGVAVVNGTACFNQAGNVLTITNSNGAILNWDRFSIKAGATTHFQQTSASSSVLNRVLNDPTYIYGTLSSNGRVWLVNPAGVMVGPGGRVDVAGFVASTLNIRNEDFLAGRSVFINDGSAQNVINQGEIRTPAGGSVYLIGSNVVNEGIILTPGGETILAAGATVSLIDSATPGVKVDITGAEGNATNLGSITAEAGRIGIAGVIVRNSGTLNASSVVSEGGRVFLKASQDAYVDGNGRIVTTGTKGGSVEVLGNRVAVMDNAEIDASGANGGGRILVGGDYQGKNPDIQNANITWFGPNASLKANATEVGAGGTVIVWADDTTRAYGSISARGGALGGNGGLVETSGKRYLDTPGIRVDVGAGNGKGGVWLLDPSSINIVASGTSTTTTYGGPPVEFTYGGSVGTLVDDDINTALGGGDVIVHTYGGTIGGNISANGVNIYGGGSLTLAAYGGDIDIYGGSIINLALGNGSFKALAGWNGAPTYYGSDLISGTGNIKISESDIFVGPGEIDLHAGNNITLGKTDASVRTLIQSNGKTTVSAKNLSLLGGTATSGPQGPYVMLRSDTEQKIKVNNQILLQAGSANNTLYGGFGSMFYGGSVVIQSGGNQEIEATTLKILAGTQGHDNVASVDAYGSQTIILGKEGPGQLIITGGGDGTATYGGAYGGGTGGGSYNNFAELRQGSSTGNQVIEFESLGSSIQVTGGGGTGYGGFFSPSHPEEEGWSSNNFAAIHNQGDGSSNAGYAQVIDFRYGGTLTVTGGTLGNGNFASIGNQSQGMMVIGSSNAVDTPSALANLPDITLTGGAYGGKDFGAGGDNLSNSADIYSEATSALADISGSSITINGGGDADTIGGAGISANTLLLRTPGNLTLTGGGSDLVTASPISGAATAAYIGSDGFGDTNITIEAGDNINLTAGTGYGGAVLIGTVDGGVSTTIDIGAYGGITMQALGKSSVVIGNVAPDLSGGADVTLKSIGNLTATGNPDAQVWIGSLNGGSSNGTNVTLGSMRNIALTDTQVGSVNGANAGPASIAVYGGFMENGSPSTYGGSLSFTRTKFGSAFGDAAIGFYAAYGSGAGAGNITFSNGGGAYGSSIDIVAARDLKLEALTKGVRLQTTTGLMSIQANNFYAYGGTGIRGLGDTNLIGEDVSYAGAGISVIAGSSVYGQTINVTDTLELRAGSIANPNGSGIPYYGGSVTFKSVGNQLISAGKLKLVAGAAGHDNAVQIIGEGATQDITVSTLLDLKGGGGGTNNFAWIGATGVLGVQTINAGGASIVLTGGASGGAPNLENSADISLSDMTNTGGSQTVYAGNITINGGSSTTAYGGAGFGTGNGLDQSFYVTGDLTMNGGASPAYIGSEYGGGTIIAQVGGKIALNGGTGTYGGVLIGSLDDSLGATTVKLSAAKGITAIGSTGGVLLGVKNLTGSIGNSVALNAGWDGIAPSSYGGDITLTGPVLVKTDGATGSVDMVAYESGAGAYGGVTIGTGTVTVVYGSSIGIVAGGNNTVYGSLISTGDIYLDAGWNPYGGGGLGSPSLLGGDLNLKTGSNLQAGTFVELYARAGTNSPYGGGSINQSGSLVANTNISMYADRNVSINGSVSSNDNDIYVRAGYSATRQFGGNIEVRGALSGYSGVELVAEAGSSTGANGNITQYDSSSITTVEGDVRIIGGRDIKLSGSIDGGEGAVTVKAGFSDYGGTVTLFGGNIWLTDTSRLTATTGFFGVGHVNLYAEAGSGSDGSVTQDQGSIVTAYGGDLKIFGGGNVTLNGSASAYGGSGSVRAGYSASGVTASANGGNIQVSGKLFADYDLELLASAGSSSGLNGNITQNTGSVISTNNYDITIVSAGDTTINGKLSAGERVSIGAGLDPLNPSNSAGSGYGGNILFGAGSIVESRNGKYDDVALAIVTLGGSRSQGDIIQAASSQLILDYYYGYANVLAYGDARMNGTTTINGTGGYGINVVAGAENAFGLGSTFSGGIRAGSSNIVSVGRFSAIDGGYVRVKAAGAILRSSISNPNGPNVVTDDAELTSVYGGSSGGLAISAITEATGSIIANVTVGASYGGISIINLADQPSTVTLADNATNAGKGLNGGPASISFYNAGNLALDGSAIFTSNNGGAIAIASGGSLDYTSGLTSTSGGILLGAGSVLNMYGGLTTAGNLGLAAGSVLNIDNPVSGANVTLVAPTVKIDSGVTATADAIVTGSTIDIYGGSVTGANILFRGAAFGTGNLKLSNGGFADASGQLEFNLANVDADGGHLAAPSSTSNITGFVSGNITLDNGAYFLAGDDIDLTLTGSTSTVSLSNGAHMVSDTASGTVFTTFLNFLARGGDGVKIDGTTTTTSTPGSSGFFVLDHDTPATTTSGGGLVITYANAVIVDPCAATPDLCKPPSPIDPIIDVVEADPCATSPDSAQCKAIKAGEKEEEEKDKFGDEATDGKKDEKSSQKKVAQCGV